MGETKTPVCDGCGVVFGPPRMEVDGLWNTFTMAEEAGWFIAARGNDAGDWCPDCLSLRQPEREVKS